MAMIELHGISKSYPGVKSLDRVSFSADCGEVHALLGENGAGKSTLTRIISGASRPDEGEIRFQGALRRWSSPREAQLAGIHVIHQELQTFPELTVAENIFLGCEPTRSFGRLDRAAMRQGAGQILARLGHTLDPELPAGSVSVADRQIIEIARALVGDAKLLILDEPTAALSAREAARLFDLLRELKSRDVAVIYISHRLEEVEEVCDRLTVLKDGRLAGTGKVSETPRARMVAMMVGRELQEIFPRKRPAPADGSVILAVRRLASAPRVLDVSFELREGEILGIAGLVGSGRSETAQAIFGCAARPSGSVLVDGQVLPPLDVRAAIAAGIGYVTEDRKGEGLLMRHTMAANVSAPVLARHTRHGWLDTRSEAQAADEEIRRFRVAIPGPLSGVALLSGGNQQKILLARWARACRRVLILDEPTRGVDVGAKAEIYRAVQELAATGIGIVVISSELPEVVGLADRVVVMRAGRSVGEVAGAGVNEHDIMTLAALGEAA